MSGMKSRQWWGDLWLLKVIVRVVTVGKICWNQTHSFNLNKSFLLFPWLLTLRFALLEFRIILIIPFFLIFIQLIVELFLLIDYVAILIRVIDHFKVGNVVKEPAAIVCMTCDWISWKLDFSEMLKFSERLKRFEVCDVVVGTDDLIKLFAGDEWR